MNNRLLKLYGISAAEYEMLLVAQGGRCPICLLPLGTYARQLAVDHDHVTGRVRGLLCHKCNMALGVFKDDVYKLNRAIEYLTKEDAWL